MGNTAFSWVQYYVLPVKPEVTNHISSCVAYGTMEVVALLGLAGNELNLAIYLFSNSEAVLAIERPTCTGLCPMNTLV